MLVFIFPWSRVGGICMKIYLQKNYRDFSYIIFAAVKNICYLHLLGKIVLFVKSFVFTEVGQHN